MKGFFIEKINCYTPQKLSDLEIISVHTTSLTVVVTQFYCTHRHNDSKYWVNLLKFYSSKVNIYFKN